jgi:hypothetical protein
MSTRQLQGHAYIERSSSTEIKRKYHTFDYYWCERYARVYQLPSRIRPVSRVIH